MNWRKYTIIVTLTLVTLLIAWDIFVAVTPEERDTVSAVVLDWSRARTGLAWAFGALCGHLFWPSSKPRPTWADWATPFTLLSMAVLLVLVPGFANALFPGAAVAFLVGFPFGRLLWPQYRPEEDEEKAAPS